MTGQLVAVVHLVKPPLLKQDFKGISHICGIHATVGNRTYFQLMQVIQQGRFCQIVMQGELAKHGG
ncbi:hypothetical protein [Serratia marcescens]|uniref:hypothetical protein n=1 Tax=Serratia marcescens TaxID=615 RepID=UPI0024A65AF1|nr:hypothetical protein [Serratia marcescens]